MTRNEGGDRLQHLTEFWCPWALNLRASTHSLSPTWSFCLSQSSMHVCRLLLSKNPSAMQVYIQNVLRMGPRHLNSPWNQICTRYQAQYAPSTSSVVFSSGTSLDISSWTGVWSEVSSVSSRTDLRLFSFSARGVSSESHFLLPDLVAETFNSVSKRVVVEESTMVARVDE